MKTFNIGKQSFLRVSGTFPCPICQKRDWCFVNMSQTKAYCCRQLDDSRPQFADATVYDLTGREAVAVVQPTVKQERLAKANRLHQVYTLVLSLLGLSNEHMAHLVYDRGLSTESVALRGYATASQKSLKKQVLQHDVKDGQTIFKTVWEGLFLSNGLPADAWKGVPGFWYSEEYQTPIFTPVSDVKKEGILIPCRNSWGQIVGLQIRIDSDKLNYHAELSGEQANAFRDKFKAVVRSEAEGLFFKIYQLPDYELVTEGLTTDKHLSFSNGLEFEIKPSAKYLWVSTAYKEYGTPASAKTHFSFPDTVLQKMRIDEQGNSRVPLVSLIDNIIVTEGLLKGDIVANLAPTSKLRKLENLLVISMAGVSSWKQAANEVRKLDQHKVYLAFDQDFEDNEQVLERLASMVAHLKNELSISAQVMVWEDSKGLDDFLLEHSEANQHITLWS